MPEIALDFSDVPDGIDYGAPIRPGTYNGMVDKVELRTGKDSGKEYLNFECHITDDGEFSGRKVWSIVSFAEKALPNTKRVLQSFGLTSNTFRMQVDDDSNLLTEPDLTDAPVVLSIKNEQYEGEIRNRVTKMLGKRTASSTADTAAPRREFR